MRCPRVSIVPQTDATASANAGPKPAPVASQPAPAQKVAASAPHPHINDRPGYVLNDTQIASIKDRLHLTPDQEQMWPAVEAALRNIAYTRAQQARSLTGSARRRRQRTNGGRRSECGARPQIGGGAADHEFQCRAKRRSAQSRPRHGARSARVAVLIKAGLQGCRRSRFPRGIFAAGGAAGRPCISRRSAPSR